MARMWWVSPVANHSYGVLGPIRIAGQQRLVDQRDIGPWRRPEWRARFDTPHDHADCKALVSVSSQIPASFRHLPIADH
jgi:hypothetical protein